MKVDFFKLFFLRSKNKAEKNVELIKDVKLTEHHKAQLKFLDEKVFYGLNNLNNGFDSEVIKYFSEQEFQIILDRVKFLELGILGIEPWKDGVFYGVDTYEQYATEPKDSSWYLASFDRFKKMGDTIQYSATYFIPEYLLNK